MRLPIYQVDAFADAPFQGNPAAVVPLERWLDDGLTLVILHDTPDARDASDADFESWARELRGATTTGPSIDSGS